MSFSYNSEFVLDKPHFHECYQQTAVVKSGISAYKKPIFLFVLGMLAASVAQTISKFSHVYYRVIGC